MYVVYKLLVLISPSHLGVRVWYGFVLKRDEKIKQIPRAFLSENSG